MVKEHSHMTYVDVGKQCGGGLQQTSASLRFLCNGLFVTAVTSLPVSISGMGLFYMPHKYNNLTLCGT
jgi:hypothetical protein